MIKDGKLSGAATLLTRPVSILGTVIHGAALGRQWGVPTANINPNHEIIPPAGIYAVRALVAGKLRQGICYIGAPPAFLGARGHARSYPNIEVHLFDFNQNIYGRDIEIHFSCKIRDRKEFKNRDDLIKQINKDIKKARRS